MTNPANTFDTPWKVAIEVYLQAFFAFFYPRIHAEIDWTRPITFLDTELAQVVRDADLGLRLADKLVRVWRRDNTAVWVLVHIEVQSQYEAGFAKRMFVYFTRISDRYDGPVASLAILADTHPTWRPAAYREATWGCSVDFRYPAVKLRRYQRRRAELEASDNPFATIVLAHLAAQATRRSVARRQAAKLGLVRRLYERGYDREQVLNLFRFIDWLLALPEEGERAVRQWIQTWEEEHQMSYITSIERMGRAEGREEGIAVGREEGREEAMRESVRRILEVRFGILPENLIARIAAANTAELDTLLERAVLVASLTDL